MFNTRLAPLCAALIGAFATFGAHAWTVPDPTNDGSPNPTTVSKGWMDDGTGRSVPIPADSWYSGAKAIDMTQKQPAIPLPDYVTGLRPWTEYFPNESKCGGQSGGTTYCAEIDGSGVLRIYAYRNKNNWYTKDIVAQGDYLGNIAIVDPCTATKLGAMPNKYNPLNGEKPTKWLFHYTHRTVNNGNNNYTYYYRNGWNAAVGGNQKTYRANWSDENALPVVMSPYMDFEVKYTSVPYCPPPPGESGGP